MTRIEHFRAADSLGILVTIIKSTSEIPAGDLTNPSLTVLGLSEYEDDKGNKYTTADEKTFINTITGEMLTSR